ncbi:MAG: hypothetical protein GWO20_00940 [Candidatus Korarchaeota archaeon]|nr:hypothetical protein [Candidatus Korarchaeota archaeon]NIU82858.1 hypothetical protein [Candidatus Thorarchaeota archaeon]NIW12552.1 hypothetical protein [Candidatus Thorarchaeota archaeon]NIW50772.1 hypothetical protein [Candidatus Korarchaeota archaeon]
MHGHREMAIVPSLLIGLLFCALLPVSVSASLESGLEALEEGHEYEFKYLLSFKSTEKDYKTGKISKEKQSTEGTRKLEIEEINREGVSYSF